MQLFGGSGEVSFYWDSSLIGSGINSNDASGGSNLLLGRRYSDPNNDFKNTDGFFDEVRLWNLARSQSDIIKNMHTWLVGDEDGLIGYWRLDDSSGTTVSDLTSNHNNGTMINMEPEEDWITTTAPIANLSMDKFDVSAIWGAQPSSLSDQYATGLDIADVTFLQSIGDDIVFGHNNAPYGLISTDLPQGIGEHWARLWELAVTNPSGDDEHVDLIFNLSDADGNPDDPFSQENGYYLLGRNVGSNDPFVIIPVIGMTVSMDQVTFRTHVADLGSEVTLGITKPIEDLAASNDGPTPIHAPTVLTSIVTSGTGITYTWDFGDGTTGIGVSTTHTYSQLGTYTAMVTASNSLGDVSASTSVEIVPAKIYLPVIIQ